MRRRPEPSSSTLLLAAAMLLVALAACGRQPEAARTPVPTPEPLALDSPFEASIVDGDDDAEEWQTGYMKLNSSTLQLVHDPSSNHGDQTVGLRFTNVMVPQGATVTTAWIQFTARKKQSGAVDLTIEGVAAGHVEPFLPSSGALSSLPRTSASVPWSPEPWTVTLERGPLQRTPDLGAIVEEVLARPDWAPGNAMAFLLGGTGARTASAFEDGVNRVATLHVEFLTCATPPCNVPPFADAGPDRFALFPEPIAIDGTALDDGAPTVSWQQVSGPGIVTFDPTNAEDTSVTATEAGTYELRLTVDDGEFQDTDDVTITWSEPGVYPTGPVIGIAQVAGAWTGFDGSGTPLPLPAIDPSGITFLPYAGTLLVSDSEIEEANVAEAWALVQANLFDTSLTADTLHASWDLTTAALGENVEPAGVAFCPYDGQLYIANDQWPRTVYRYEWNGGAPSLVEIFPVNAYITDPEGIDCDPNSGRLYVASGVDEQILVLDPAPGAGFSLVAVLDLPVTAGDPAGVPSDIEGIAYDTGSGHLFAVSRADKAIYEYDTNGVWVQTFTVAGFTGPDLKKPAGLAIAQSSVNPARQSFYIVDRRVDNDSNPDERDGALYEALIDRSE